MGHGQTTSSRSKRSRRQGKGQTSSILTGGNILFTKHFFLSSRRKESDTLLVPVNVPYNLVDSSSVSTLEITSDLVDNETNYQTSRSFRASSWDMMILIRFLEISFLIIKYWRQKAVSTTRNKAVDAHWATVWFLIQYIN